MDMNKNEFMKELSRNLSNVSEEEKQDISTDYDEYFTIGIEQGRSEENVALSLGEPKTIAKQLRANYMIEKAQSTKSSINIGRAVIAAVGLGLFNIILLGPFIAIVGILMGLYATAFGNSKHRCEYYHYKENKIKINFYGSTNSKKTAPYLEAKLDI